MSLDKLNSIEYVTRSKDMHNVGKGWYVIERNERDNGA